MLDQSKVFRSNCVYRWISWLLIAMCGVTGRNNGNDIALQYIEKSFKDLEFGSILHFQQFRCMSACISKATELKDDLHIKPQIRQPVFVLKKNIINCFNRAREVASFYKRKVHGIQLTQIRDLPLFYLSLLTQANIFMAQKFCHLHGLEFGMDKHMEKVFNKDNESLKIWSTAIIADGKRNRTLECKYFQKMNNKVVETATDCFCRANFICKLPETAHSTYCNSKCDGIFTCPATTVGSCHPDCKKEECGDELEDKFTYRASDGDLADICGKRYLFSKLPNVQNILNTKDLSIISHFMTMQLRFKTAETFCCTKYMELLSMETNNEMSCLAKEMNKMNLQNITFWTSGSSSSCPGNYAWCGVSEFLNKEEITWSAPSSIDKSCISMQVVNGTSVLDNELCSSNKRAICEIHSQNRCTYSMCYNTKCSSEIFQAKTLLKTLHAFGGVAKYSGCGREFSVNTRLTSYHQSNKWCCSSNSSLLSFETPAKLACFQEFFKTKNVTATKYWVSGSSISCSSKMKWCNGKLEPLIGEYLKWAPGQPAKDLAMECVYVEILPKTREIVFGKEKCRTALGFMCEKMDSRND